MKNGTHFEVIIVGGSYAGLSAAMALGRSLRSVLIIDSGNPCNRHTPHSHNFLTQDGKTPQEILVIAKQQLEKYETIHFYRGIATRGEKSEAGFRVTTDQEEQFTGKKLVFATGVKDLMPPLEGFAACWGISVIHCPYCHGYEFRNEKTGILANSDTAFEMSKMINHWTKDLTLFTNGPSDLTSEQTALLQGHNIEIVTDKIDHLEHTDGRINRIVFENQTSRSITALYARPSFEQHCNIPEQLGCELTDHKLLKIDSYQRTSQHGIYACGDNTTMMRAVSNAVAMGGLAGAMINKELIEESFEQFSRVM